MISETEEKFIEKAQRMFRYEDWNILTSPNRTNHHLVEQLIYQTAAQAETEQSCDDEYSERAPLQREVLVERRKRKQDGKK